MSSILDTDQMTVSGKTVAENIAGHRYLYPVDRRVIRTLDGRGVRKVIVKAPRLVSIVPD